MKDRTELAKRAIKHERIVMESRKAARIVKHTDANASCRCKKCGYAWASLVESPKVCPRCKSYTWDKESKRKVNR